MPKKIDPAVKERALRMVAEHRGEYASIVPRGVVGFGSASGQAQ